MIAEGFKIEALNWRRSRFEIDIVATKGDVLAFVEVKSSRREVLGPPELRVDRKKQKKIAEAAAEYLSEMTSLPEDIRFDVISILWKKGSAPRITHIESAFELDPDD